MADQKFSVFIKTPDSYFRVAVDAAGINWAGTGDGRHWKILGSKGEMVIDKDAFLCALPEEMISTT